MSTNYSLQKYWASERGLARKKQSAEKKGRPVSKAPKPIEEPFKPAMRGNYKPKKDLPPNTLFDTGFWWVSKTDDPSVLTIKPKGEECPYWDLPRATLEETSYIFKRLCRIYYRYTIQVTLDLSKVCYTIHLR